MTVRRVIAGPDRFGDSIMADSAAESRELVSVPGMIDTLVWHGAAASRTEDLTAVDRDVPSSGRVTFKIVTFPPDTIANHAGVDPVAVAAETARLMPALAAFFDADGSGFHATPTLDLITVVSGTPTLVMADGSSADLRAGDTVIQLAGRHRWANSGLDDAVISVVHVGTNADTEVR